MKKGPIDDTLGINPDQLCTMFLGKNNQTKTHTQKNSWGFWLEASSPSPDLLRSQEKSCRQK